MPASPEPTNPMLITQVAAPVREQVLAKLRAALFDGRFSPGERLIERELCESTGASRTSVREALRQLESEGLVTTIPNRGIVVARVDAKLASDLYAVRAALEGLAARLFTERAEKEQREQLRAALESIVDSYQSRDQAVMVAAKRRFYDVLLAGADNKPLLDTLALVHGRVHQLRATSLSRPGRPAESVAELRELVEAIERRDPDAAGWAAASHVMAAHAAAVEVLQRIQDGGADAPNG